MSFIQWVPQFQTTSLGLHKASATTSSFARPHGCLRGWEATLGALLAVICHQADSAAGHGLRKGSHLLLHAIA